MSWSELDIPDPEREGYYDDCATGAPIHTFGGLKSLLSSLGYHIEKAEGYKAIDVADVTMEEIRSGAIEFTDEGIFVTTDGVRRKVFLYKRDYHLELYGKPRAHIRKCDVINRFSDGDSIPLYRRANTDMVWVHDMDDNYTDKQVCGLNICSHCIKIALQGMKFNNRLRYAVGGEFVPKIRGNYLERIAYRAGVYYTDDYLNIRGNRLREFGLTCGFGLPTPEGKTMINLGFEWKHRAAHPQTLITENYFNINLGINVNELWFWQRRIR